MNPVLIGILLAALAGIFWGAMGVSAQYLFVQADVAPLDLVTLRLLGAGVLMVGVASLCRVRHFWTPWHSWRDGRDVLVNAALLLATHALFFLSIYYSNAGTAAIYLATVPLWAGLYLSRTEGRPIEFMEIICFVLAITGVALIITDGHLDQLQVGPESLLYGALSTVAATLYSLQPRAVLSRIGVIPVVSWGILAAGLMSLLINPVGDITVAWTPVVLAHYSFIVVIGTIVAFWLYLASLRYISPVLVGLVVCLEPLSAFAFSVLFLGDVLGGWQLLGVAFVLANVALLSARRR